MGPIDGGFTIGWSGGEPVPQMSVSGGLSQEPLGFSRGDPQVARWPVALGGLFLRTGEDDGPQSIQHVWLSLPALFWCFLSAPCCAVVSDLGASGPGSPAQSGDPRTRVHCVEHPLFRPSLPCELTSCTWVYVESMAAPPLGSELKSLLLHCDCHLRV